MIQYIRNNLKKNISFIFLAVLCAGQVFFSGCILDPPGDDDFIYEVVSVEYLHNEKPEYCNLPTRIWFVDYTPGLPLKGAVKFNKLGWLAIDEVSYPSGFHIWYQEESGETMKAIFTHLKINEHTLQGIFALYLYDFHLKECCTIDFDAVNNYGS